MNQKLLPFVLFVSSLLIAQVGSAQVTTEQPAKTDGAVVSESADSFKEKLLAAKTIVFLGDSNTNNGEFINVIETALLLQRPTQIDKKVPQPLIINLGLPSDTCCGLSEPIHPFPRPNVNDRLVQALEKTKPDIVIACFGMNDGIYHPFAETRFKAFQDGIKKIIHEHLQAKVPLILLTPPPFDPLPYRTAGKLVGKDAKEFSWKTIYENYDSEVMKKYSDWMQAECPADGCKIIDIHTPINIYLDEKRKTNPKFVFSKDGVHVNTLGHHVFANAILEPLGFTKMQFDLTKQKDKTKPLTKQMKLLQLIRKRRAVMHPAWLSEVGHKRPAIKAGLPIEKAKEETSSIAGQIERELLKL